MSLLISKMTRRSGDEETYCTQLVTSSSGTALTFLAVLCVLAPAPVTSLGCFTCQSVNGSMPTCEDTFSNVTSYYQQECFAPRPNRIGQFPGTQCIKFIARRSDPPMSLVIRDCVVDNGETNFEMEIGRVSYCGLATYLVFNEQRWQGCLLVCNTDGCNSAPASTDKRLWLTLLPTLVTVITVFSRNFPSLIFAR